MKKEHEEVIGFLSVLSVAVTAVLLAKVAENATPAQRDSVRRAAEAIQRQASELVYAGPGMATAVRARLGFSPLPRAPEARPRS